MKVLVTGGTRGIGRAVAQRLLARGAEVTITSQTLCRAEKARVELAPLGRISAAALDLSAGAQTFAVEELVSRYGPFSHLVNNAAWTDGPRAERDWPVAAERARLAICVTFLGAAEVALAVLPSMVEQERGRIVFVTASSRRIWRDVSAGSLGYKSAKAGISTFARVLAAEVQDIPDLRINCVDPGWVNTDMGGPRAPREAHVAADDVLAALDVAKNGPNGSLFVDRGPATWA